MHNINTIISQNETKAPKQPWNIILSTNISSKVCCQKMFDLKCKWLQWSGCSWSHLEATSRLQENQSTIGHLQRSFLCCLIFLIRDGKDHIEHQWLMMISRSGSCVIVSGPIWTWQSRTTIGYDFDTTKKRWPSKRRHRCVDDTQVVCFTLKITSYWTGSAQRGRFSCSAAWRERYIWTYGGLGRNKWAKTEKNRNVWRGRRLLIIDHLDSFRSKTWKGQM